MNESTRTEPTMKLRTLLFALLLFLLPAAHAQNTRFYPKKEIGCQTFHAICQDADGFLWIATEYGLYKFDGTDFSPYFHYADNPGSLANDDVHALLIDDRDRLWVGTANGLQCYLPEEDAFRLVQLHDIDVLNGYITDIVQLSSGEICFIASGIGLFRVDDAAMVAYKVEEVDSYRRTLRQLYEDCRMNRWLIRDRGGVVRIAPDGRQQSYLTEQVVEAVIEDADGRLLLLTESRMWLYNSVSDDMQPLECPKIAGGGYLRSLLLTRSGELLVGTTGNGVMCLPRRSNRLEARRDLYNPFVEIDRANVHALFEDRFGNIWFGCDYSGLLMLPKNPMPFRFWDMSQQLTNGQITALYHDRAGSVWCAVEGNGLFRLNENGMPVAHIATPQSVTAICEDSRGNFWIGMHSLGLYSVDRARGTLQCRYAMQGSFPVRSIVEDDRGRLYVSITGEGLLCYDTVARTSALITVDTHAANENLMNYWMTALCYTRSGRLYTGHFGGVSCYDPQQGDFVPMMRVPELRQSAVYALVEARDGSIWIGTNLGLFHYRPSADEIDRFSTADGLSSDMVGSVVEDENGCIWCGTFQGINRIDPATRRITRYFTGNGLIDHSYVWGLCSTDRSGRIYLAGDTGITSFVPADIREPELNSGVVVTNLLVKGRPVTMQSRSGGQPVIRQKLTEVDRIRLSHADNTFTIFVSTLDFRDASNVSYQYRLKELGSEWDQTLAGENRIQYHHLPPRDYTLQLRAFENGSWSPVKSVSIHISPPWYQTVVAKILYGLCLLALGYLCLLAMKRRRRAELNEAKLKLFIDLSHEIRSPMTLIISPLEQLIKRGGDRETMRLLQTMHRNAHRILRLVNQLLDVRKIDKGQLDIRCSETDLVAFVSEVAEAFREQAEQRQITLQVVPEQAQLPVWIDRNHFDKVLVNLLSNAFKYTPEAGTITIRIASGCDARESGPLHRYASITVADTGVGLDEKEFEKIFDRFYQGQANRASRPIGFGIGLNLCRMLVKLHHGTIAARNNADGPGSCFEVRLPLGCGHLSLAEREEQLPASERAAVSVLPVEPPRAERVEKRKTNYRVLVIDDDEELNHFLCSNLSAIYKVETALNGAEGWKKAVTLQPDAIVSDVRMPEIDGLQLLKMLKTNGNTNHIPIILLSSRTEAADRISGIDRGADGYLAKPFNLEELKAMIAGLIANRIRLKGKYSGAQTPDGRLKSRELQGNDDALMERIMQVINAQLEKPEFNVELLAKEIGLSRTQLHRKMKELTGMSSSDFIRNLRLRQAVTLLQRADVNITQVAYAVGFTSQSHFSTAFKKLYGVTPSEYAADPTSRLETKNTKND